MSILAEGFPMGGVEERAMMGTSGPKPDRGPRLGVPGRPNSSAPDLNSPEMLLLLMLSISEHASHSELRSSELASANSVVWPVRLVMTHSRYCSYPLASPDRPAAEVLGEFPNRGDLLGEPLEIRLTAVSSLRVTSSSSQVTSTPS